MGAPDPATYAAHLAEVVGRTSAVLEAVGGFGGCVFHAGSVRCQHRDDLEVPFRTDPHFARFAPLAGPGHLLRVRPDRPPLLVRVSPRDFWSAAPTQWPHPWSQVLDVVEVASAEEAVRALGPVGDCAFVGAAADVARALGIDDRAVEPADLLAGLDWHRAAKTPYEVACHRAAAERAALGHAAARAGAAAGASEREIHAAYLQASGQLEGETPYPNIIGWDDHAAVLHYGEKSPGAPGLRALLLIDAGATAWGYASDITRTHLTARAPGRLVELVAGVERLQRRLVEAVGPGIGFESIHRRALEEVAALLCDVGLVRGAPGDAVERGIVAAFLPHGVGHLLGLQVHDVGGLHASVRGGLRAPAPAHSRLRNTRTCEPGHVVTVEPGVYFIPMLLEPLRSGAVDGGDALDWDGIDALAPFGGIRVEDDVLVTAEGREDLSRPFVPAGAGTPESGP